jgi:hypothetical protein
MFVPATVSLVLGIVYLMMGTAGPVAKCLGAAVFLVAVYLQFFSRWPLAGLLMQIGLALCLELWRRLGR